MVGQTLDMEQWQERRERLELEGHDQMPPDSYYAEDEEMERELNELGTRRPDAADPRPYE